MASFARLKILDGNTRLTFLASESSTAIKFPCRNLREFADPSLKQYLDVGNDDLSDACHQLWMHWNGRDWKQSEWNTDKLQPRRPCFVLSKTSSPLLLDFHRCAANSPTSQITNSLTMIHGLSQGYIHHPALRLVQFWMVYISLTQNMHISR